MAVPAAVGSFAYVGETWPVAVVTVAFLFGGMVFGPDLDTKSKPYSRWGTFRFLWLPYRKFFKHRSRFTHGLVFGSLFRVVYFVGVVTLVAYMIAYAWTAFSDDAVPDIRGFAAAWRTVADMAHKYLGENFLLLSFVGIWLGAASHTFSDIAITYIKTGRVDRMF